MSNLKSKIIYFLPILILFEAYSFFSIGYFSVTPAFVAITLVVILGFLEGLTKQTLKISNVLITLAYIVVVTLSFTNALYNPSVTSMMLYIFYIIFFLLSTHKHDVNRLDRSFSLYVLVVTIASIYGIYQFIAYLNNLPLQDLLIPGFMTQGYNTVSYTKIVGITVRRANSIFLEPSFLSQFAAISIILLVNNKPKIILNPVIRFVFILLNFIALIISFAGTGFIILTIGFVYLFVKSSRKVKSNILVILCVVSLFLVVFFPEFFQFALNRLNEFENINASSGIRFVYSYYAMFEAMKQSMWGYGPGNDSLILSFIGINESNVASGYAKIGIELGFFGLMMLIIILIKALINIRKKGLALLYIFVLLINYLGGNYLTNYFWSFLALINVNSIYHHTTITQSHLESNYIGRNAYNLENQS